MPETNIILFAEVDGTCPVIGWLDGLPPKVQDKCIVRIERLAKMGHELRRPEADYLRDGIYELRVRHMNVHYRMLYFFHGKQAVITHGMVKEGKVPEQDIKVAKEHKNLFDNDPSTHTYWK